MKVEDLEKRRPIVRIRAYKYVRQSRDRKGAVAVESALRAVTYLITFSCYGCHLHGSDSGSVDGSHRLHATPLLETDVARATAERNRMHQPPYYLDRVRRDAVLEAMRQVCAHHGWELLAAHVRTTHVHAVVEAEVSPERVMNVFKVYASRRLNRMALDEPDRKRWTRHGSTRWLWKPQHISAAIQYVVAEQGAPMSVLEFDES